MPIKEFHGETIVCYIDISGFKVMMQDMERARQALGNFYQSGYDILQRQEKHVGTRVDGLFVSDCGILFVRTRARRLNLLLSPLLKVVQSLNRQMLHYDIMLTTSIAYGSFHYNPRREFIGITKNLVYGAPYVEAYLDNEVGRPKLDPGQCRLLIGSLSPSEINSVLNSNDEYFKRTIRKGRKHLYFYWMLSDPREIEMFEKNYTNAYDLKYSGMLSALKRGGQW